MRSISPLPLDSGSSHAQRSSHVPGLLASAYCETFAVHSRHQMHEGLVLPLQPRQQRNSMHQQPDDVPELVPCSLQSGLMANVLARALHSESVRQR
jgi:hypothetical protein